MMSEGRKADTTGLTAKLVETIPEDLKEGIIYISEPYRVAIHNCCCGCGNEVVTPLGGHGWGLTMNNGKATLNPSIGSFALDCKSHYWIRDGEVEWV